MTKTLTSRQSDVLAFVRGYLDAHGYPPATREIAQELDITDTAAHGHLVAIERKGHLRRAPGIARGITLTDSSGSGIRQEHHLASRHQENEG